MSGLTYGELCAGYGGLGLGVQSVLGGDTAWVSEFDPHPSRILAHHWPDVPNLGDMTRIDWTKVEPVDVLTGGTPCQDLSHAGKRAGMTEGTRSNLWVQMREAIHAIRPKLVVWENVRGAFSAPADSDLEWCAGCMGERRPEPALRALGRVLGDLADLGYDAWWYGLRAADVGACHGRFRVFVFATSRDAARDDLWHDALAVGGGAGGARQSAGGSDRTAADARGVRGLEAVGRHGRGSAEADGRGIPDQRHRDALRAGPDGGLTLLPTPVADNSRGLPQSGTDYASLPNVAVSLLPTPRATDGTKGGPNQRGSSGDLMLPSAVHLLPTPRAARGGSATETGRLLPTPSAATPDSRRSRRDGSTYSADGYTRDQLGDVVAQQDWSVYEAAIRRHEAVLGRHAPAPTEPGPKGGARLSPVFVEWMMMLPHGWVTDPAIWEGLTDKRGKVLTGDRLASAARNAELKALGNGVVPPQSAAACRAFLRDSREVAA